MVAMNEPALEADAVRADAAARLAELRAVAEVLRPGRDDALVLSELVTVESQIGACEKAPGR